MGWRRRAGAAGCGGRGRAWRGLVPNPGRPGPQVIHPLKVLAPPPQAPPSAPQGPPPRARSPQSSPQRPPLPERDPWGRRPRPAAGRAATSPSSATMAGATPCPRPKTDFLESTRWTYLTGACWGHRLLHRPARTAAARLPAPACLPMSASQGVAGSARQ